MPRVAALLDVAQMSEIVSVESADTFVRPIYAGNVLATVQSSDRVKVITVRPTAFAKAGEGGTAMIERLTVTPDQGQSRVVSRDPVSYTHLDVYKRQGLSTPPYAPRLIGLRPAAGRLYA